MGIMYNSVKMRINFKGIIKKSSKAINEIYRFCKRRLRKVSGSVVRPRTVKAYLRSHKVHNLQIGAGANILDGWLNTNEAKFSSRVIFLDAAKAFPFEDSTFDYIFSEHQIEHLTFQEGQFMLRECMRVLKPGGKIRIATPDLEMLLGLYASQQNEIQQRYIKWIGDAYSPQGGACGAVFVINNAFYNWEHRFLYDPATLRDILGKAGFVDITRYPPGESDDEVLRGIEHHGKAIGDEEMNRFETMVLEGRRPG